MVEYHINHAAVYSVSSSTSPRPSPPPFSTCRGLATSNAYNLANGHHDRYRHPKVQHVQPTAYQVLMELPSGQDTLSRSSVARPNRWIRKHSPWSNLQQPGNWNHSISHVPAGPCSSKGSYDRPAWTFLRSGPSRRCLRSGHFRRCLRSSPFRHHLRSGTPRRCLRSGPGRRFLRFGPCRRHLRSGTPRRCLRSGPGRRFLRFGPCRRHLRSSTSRRCLRSGTSRRCLRSGPFRRCLRSIPLRHHLRSGTSRRFLRSGPFRRCLRSGPFRRCLRSGPFRRHLRSSTSRRCLRSGTSRRFLRSGHFRRHLRSSTPRRCLHPGPSRCHLRPGPGPIRPGPFPHHLHTSAARTRVPAGYHHRGVGVYLSAPAAPILPTTAGISPSTTTHYDLAIPTTPPLPSHQAGTTTRNDRSLRRTAPTPAQTSLPGPCSNNGRHRPLLEGHPAHCGPVRRRDWRTGPVPTIQRSCQSRSDHFTRYDQRSGHFRRTIPDGICKPTTMGPPG